MPKQKITEIDSTYSVINGSSPVVVYIPGPYDTSVVTAVASKPILYTSLSSLETGAKTYAYKTTDMSYKIAKHLVRLGLYVLFEGVAETQTIIEGQSVKTPVVDWTRLQDKGLYDIRFITLGGYNHTQSDMLECATKRGDCVALLDHPITIEDVKLSTYSLTTSEPEDWELNYTSYFTRSGSAGSYIYTNVSGDTAPTWTANTYYSQDVDSTQVGKVRHYFESFKDTNYDLSCSSAFTPSFKSSSSDLSSDKSLVNVPASAGYLFAFARSVINNPEYYAIAGSFRGSIPELDSVNYEYGNAECEMLQGRAVTSEVELDEEGDNVGCAINPIANINPFGYILWGDRTFKENDGSTTATSYLGVRNLVCSIRKQVFETSRKFAFEQNTDILWANFYSDITPLLDKMKSNGGLSSYKVVQLSTTAKSRLKARITITPIESCEDFEIEVQMTNNSVTIEG